MSFDSDIDSIVAKTKLKLDLAPSDDWLAEFRAMRRPAIVPGKATPLRHRLTRALDALPALPLDAWPRALGTAIAKGDFLNLDRDRLCAVLALLHRLHLPVVDTDDARTQFASLPARLTVWRGTCTAELDSKQWGVSWSLDRAAASHFALRHEIARFSIDQAGRHDIGEKLGPGFRSASAILAVRVHRADVAGLLITRGEREILIHPSQLRHVRVADHDVDAFEGVDL
jgi:hypothetical protein